MQFVVDFSRSGECRIADSFAKFGRMVDLGLTCSWRVSGISVLASTGEGEVSFSTRGSNKKKSKRLKTAAKVIV